MSKKIKTTPTKNSSKNGPFGIEEMKISISSDDTVRIESKKVRPQRALILQGGGALGAYEAGVFRSLAEELTEEDEKNGEKDRPLFDIVAGSSIGAVNAALLVSYVVQNKSWIGADNMLYQFWDDLSNPTWWAPGWVKDNPIFIRWRQFWIDSVQDNDLNGYMWNCWKVLREIWNKYYNNNYPLVIENDIKYERPLGFPIPYLTDDWPYFGWIGSYENWKEEKPWISSFYWWPENLGPIASGETARRYFSYARSVIFGAPHVLSPAIMQPDWKFFDPAHSFTRFDNKPLERTIKKYWDYDKLPLKTYFEKNQPRLLLVSVDVQDCRTAVAFDSYEKENGRCKTEYGDDTLRHVFEYDGITIDHVAASMSTHLRYKYPKFRSREESVENYSEDGQVVRGEKVGITVEQKDRYFWDGAYLSNTPLREVLQAHRDYWHKVRNAEVPDLEIYIVNLYPSTEKSLSGVIADLDVIQDREIDIKFHDRTDYDIQAANTTTDYVDLTKAIIDLALKHTNNSNSFQSDLVSILNSQTRSKGRNRMYRKYGDLLAGRFRIIKVGYIERIDDGNTIFGKAFEFSYRTVNDLRDSGYRDASENMRYD